MKHGLNLIPIKTVNKEPPLQWKDYQYKLSTEEEHEKWRGQGHRFGVVCGQISGNLEIIDFDWDAEPTLWAWKEKLRQDYGLDVDTLGIPVVKTIKGYHLYYRCKIISSADLLASRSSDGKTLIETRGEGSYVVSPIEDSMEQYHLVEGDFEAIPEVTPDIRDAMLACARSFDQKDPQVVYVKKELPGEDYNERVPWEEILEKDGWTKLRERMDGVTEWTRPGKREGISATTGINDADILYVFTSSMSPLVAGKGYSKFGYYTTVHHNGDPQSAAKKLAKEGFGKPKGPPKDNPWLKMAKIVEEATLIQDDKGEGYIVMPNGVAPIMSLASKNYFLEKYKELTGKVPISLMLLTQAVDFASVLAMSGDTYHMEPRITHKGDVTYVDLCNSDARDYMKVSAAGCEKVRAPEGIYLARNSGQKEIHWPDFKHGEIGTLRKYLNVEDEVSWELVKLWLVGSTCPTGSKPILLLHGGAGAGKTTFTRILKEILDPCDPSVLTYPKGQEDIRIHSNNHNVIPYDNLSGITNSLSDALSTLATGVGYQVRKLYTDSDTYFIKAKRSIILNGIDPVARRGDFASRSINVELSSDISKRLTEKEIEAGVAKHIDKWRAWVWGASVIGRRNADKIRLSNDVSFRLADMAKFLKGCEDKLSLTHTVEELLGQNKSELDSGLREADSVTLMLIEYMTDKQKISGTTSVLYNDIAEWGGRKIQRIKDWPDSPVGFGYRLNRGADYLKGIGIVVSKKRVKSGTEYTIENTSLS